MKKLIVAIGLLCLLHPRASAQQDSAVKNNSGSRVTSKWSLHFQATVIPQAHSAFTAAYSGDKSMLTSESPKVSLTTTLFVGRSLWKGANVYVNPEISGGSGLSKAQGVAGFPNGETFRIGSTRPKLYLGRLYLEQRFALSPVMEKMEDNINQVAGAVPAKYISIRAGKFSLADFFDNNTFSHDPRTQFLNWSLMSVGAWDYPANTRGYTTGLVAEYHIPGFALRGAVTQVPEEANGPTLDQHLNKAFGTIAEAEKTFSLPQKQLIVLRVAGFYNKAHMGSYNEALTRALIFSTVPDVTYTRSYGHAKSGYYLNAEYQRPEGGYFLRFSHNDGKNETWAFTEIDQSLALGLSFNGSAWKRRNDQWGIAFVNNSISVPHRDYLAKGGYGFIIGDGKIQYSAEMIGEAFYSFNVLPAKLYLSPDYQFILHPAYNKDRGPVHVYGLRFHVVL